MSDASERAPAAGDVHAFLQLYEEHATEVRAVARRFFPAPFEQEEAVQEIWLQVHRGIASYDAGRGSFAAWVRAVAQNRCREMLRAARRRPPASPDDDWGEASDTRVDPEQEVRRHRLQAAVAEFTRRLTPALADVLRLALIDELSHEQIAGRLGISVRRSKYLKKLVLARATRDRGLKAALDELRGAGR